MSKMEGRAFVIVDDRYLESRTANGRIRNLVIICLTTEDKSACAAKMCACIGVPARMNNRSGI